MRKILLLSTLAAAICINCGALASQSDWDAMWQSDDWQGLSGESGYETQQNNTSQRDDISKQCQDSDTGVIYTKDAIIYCPTQVQDLGRWGGN